MIEAALGTDVFVLWSVPYAVARGLVPHTCQPTRTGRRGWISFAAVELSRVTVLGCPLPGTWRMAAWLVLLDVGTDRRGNYFSRLYADSRLISAGARALGLDKASQHGQVRLERDHKRIDAEVPGAAAMTLIRDPGSAQAHPEVLDLFAANRSGLFRIGRKLYECRLRKRRWAMRPCTATVHRASFLHQLDARLEHAFDASDDVGSWSSPMQLEEPRCG